MRETHKDGGMDPESLRADVPAFDRTRYMNTGASSPAPRRVVRAAQNALEAHEFDSPAAEGMYPHAFSFYDAVRDAVGGHLGTSGDDVALTTSTSDGMARIAAAMDWQPDDVVVRTDLEHPAGTLPWQRLRETHGVEVRVVETQGGHVDLDDWREAVADAKLAAFSSICWTSGSRLDVETLTEVAHEAGARVLVDAVQSVGQRPVDVTEWGADAVAAASHKWLLGPWGAGFTYVAPEFARELTPATIGYMSVETPTDDPYTLKPNANRLEIGTLSPAPYAGLREALSLVDDLGYDTITSRIERLTDRLKDGLDDDRLVSPRDYESGLVTFTVDGDPEAEVKRMKEEGVVVRDLPTGDVRASLHVFNTEGDVDALLDLL
jgi:cysteine desulfurase/selenocysteine lyase